MSPLASQIVAVLESTPKQFSEIADAHLDLPWREFLQAWGEVRAADIVKRDGDGAYYIDAAEQE
ncbi:MAG: hypothetical protein QGI63_04245 [Rhodospirillales bacterium]|nr:hypothetical protein [Rhodospirillales bacterium]MDP6773460.1 hypothetical protein [Rhodospirillales bacterium]